MTNISLGESLRERMRMAVLFASSLFIILVLALALSVKPAWALCDPDVGCTINYPPTIIEDNASVTVNEGQTATNSGTYDDINGDAVTITASTGNVTQDDANGTWSWSYGTNDGPAQNQTITIHASDGTSTRSVSFTLNVNNVAPTANFNAPDSVNEGSPINIYMLSGSDPSSADTAAGFSYAFDCGSGFGSFGPDTGTSCPTNDNGSRTVKARIKDKDGWISEYTHDVNVTNVAPTATFDAPDSTPAGGSFTVSMTNPQDPSSADTTAGFTYAYDCDNDGQYENGSDSNGVSAVCPAPGGRAVMMTVNAKISDKNGGVSTYTKNISLTDNAAPSGTISINGGAAYTRNTAVNLTLNASDPSPGSGIAGMCFSNDGANWSDWEPYATSKSWALPSGDGTKTVRVQYSDWHLNTSTVQDTIKLDTIKPIVTGMSPRPTSTTTDTTPTIKATVKDNLTNLAKANIKLYVNGALISTTKYSYSAATDLLTYNSPKLSKGKKTMKIVATDAAGNVGVKSWYFTIV